MYRHTSSGEVIIDEDEDSADDRDPHGFQSPRAEQPRAAASEAEVASPEQPQQHRRVGVTVVGGPTFLQTPVSAMYRTDIDMHDAAVGPGTTAGKSAQQNFLASVLQGVPLPRRQACTSIHINSVLNNMFCWKNVDVNLILPLANYMTSRCRLAEGRPVDPWQHNCSRKNHTWRIPMVKMRFR